MSMIIRCNEVLKGCHDCMSMYENRYLVTMEKQPNGFDIVMCHDCHRKHTKRLSNDDYEIKVIRKGKRNWEMATMEDIEYTFDNDDEDDYDEGDIKVLHVHDKKTGKSIKLDTKTEFFEDSFLWFPVVPKKSYLKKQIERQKKLVDELETWYEDLYKEKYQQSQEQPPHNKKRKVEQKSNDSSQNDKK